MKIRRLIQLTVCFITACSLSYGTALGEDPERPNIIIYLADDLGYGSTNAYGARGELVQTPAIDRLVKSGVQFMEGYATGSVCSPTRYGLLTGRYSWRGRLQHGVVNAYDPLLIESDTTTLPEWLREAGYVTAHFGKWHLGYYDQPFSDFLDTIRPGPITIGFDYHFGVPNNMDDVHKIFIENDEVFGLRSRKLSPYGKSFYGKQYAGYDAPQRNEPELMEVLTTRAVEWIEEQDGTRPFFLYFGAVAVHHPIMPSPLKRGTSNAGAYGDFIHDLDYSVEQLMAALERKGILNNTLVIFLSDNGGDIPEDAMRPENQAVRAGLAINGDLRGDKHTIYEGGLRVPFVVSWPNKIASGKSSALVVSTDLFATITDLLKTGAMPNSAEDSISFAPILRYSSAEGIRSQAIFRDVAGRKAVRFGSWKLIDNFFPREDRRKGQHELYNLAMDPAEQTNLADSHPVEFQQGLDLLESLTR
jgi:arylsulfatase A-like enzyme